MGPEIFDLGACLLSAPLGALTVAGLATRSWNQHSASSAPSTYTLDEAIQLIRFMRGDFDIPPLFRELCCLDRNVDPSPLKRCFESADVVLIEINSPVSIQYGRYSLCRAIVIEGLLGPLSKINRELWQATGTWYNQGLMADNSEVRAETAQRLARAVADDLPDADLARAVLVDARPRRRDLASLVEGLAELRDFFNIPLGVVTYTHQYMPDGRPMPWPSDFVEQTIAAAEQLSLPIFKPSEVVKSYGADRALMPDRVHYKPEFAAALGEPLLEFVKRIAGNP